MKTKEIKMTNDLQDDIQDAVETLIVVMKLAGASKEKWLGVMGKAWDDTPIPDSLFSQRGNA